MRRTMGWLLMGLWGLAVQAPPARAGDVASPYWEPEALVATVIGVSAEPASNSKPPRVKLRVSEVLRGRVNVGELSSIWNPHFHGIDTTGREAELAAWEAAPLAKPAIGAKFILFGTMKDEGAAKMLDIHWYGKQPYSPKSLEAAQEILAKEPARRD